MISKLTESDDWPYVFAYSGTAPNEWGGAMDVPRAVDLERPERTARYAGPRSTAAGRVSEAPFGIPDVAEVLAMVDGENDGAEWVIVGRLHDGRWFSIRAGCDYTGWG